LAKRLLVALLCFVSLGIIACGDSASPDPTATTPSVSGKITVFAAASLTDAFNEIARAFEERYPGTEVEFNFAGTPTLRTQLEQGARADVFASADLAQMNIAVQSGVVASTGDVFVRNSLVVITPSSNPANIDAPADLAKSGIKLVVANPEVPVGNYTRQMLSSMEKDAAYGAGFSDRVLDNVVSEESNVRQVVSKVELGEADAGVVYGSDVTPSVATRLKVVRVPDQFNVIAQYPIAPLKEAGNPLTAEAFIDFVLSAAGQQVLQKHGFSPLS
jgi:molybdate transport system substrate-binding protein